MAEILIGEDDADVRKWLGIALESEGHDVRLACDGAETLAAVRERRPDMLILDVMMPKMSGLEVCRAVRAVDASLPIMMLTARSRDEDVVEGLSCGADEYVTKPFSMKVLFARIAAHLRRQDAAGGESAFVVGRHTVDGRGMQIIAPDGSRESLAAREYELLKLLHEHRGEVLQRDWLLDRLWGITFYGNTRTLDQHIALIRRKLGEDAEEIETVRNVGYRMRTTGGVRNMRPAAKNYEPPAAATEPETVNIPLTNKR